jgi:hypothetical protein
MNSNNTPMTGISDQDYETLLVHLSKQVAACIGGDSYEARDAASDALANTWQAEITVGTWLCRAGARLGVDTSACEGT